MSEIVVKELKDISLFSGTTSGDDTIIGTHDNGDGTSTDYRYKTTDIAGPALTDGKYIGAVVDVVDGKIITVSSPFLNKGYTANVTTTGTYLSGTTALIGSYSVGITITVNSVVGGNAAIKINWEDELNNSHTQTITTVSTTGQISLPEYVVYSRATGAITVTGVVIGTINFSVSAYIRVNFTN